jgi:hypothetical protein
MARQHFSKLELALLCLIEPLGNREIDAKAEGGLSGKRGNLFSRCCPQSAPDLNSRDASISLDMRGKATLAVLITALSVVALGQESPTPSPTLTPEESPIPSVSSSESATPSPTPEQSPAMSPARSVRISFVPPPLEGTISLGIYDKANKLVRVLQQQASLNEFAIGADALVTQWDGKNDDEQDLPSGKYHARGYLIGSLKLQDLGDSSPPAMENANATVRVKLIRNPLRNDKKAVVELGIALDGDGSYLKTIDGLPLFTVSETPNLTRAWIAKKSENAVDVWQDDGTQVHHFRVSNLDQMMAFDCGQVELR